MIVYLDTSALVPLLIREPATDRCTLLWESAESLVAIPLLYVEAAAALHKARRMNRVINTELATALRSLDALWQNISRMAVTDDVVHSAAALAGRYGLRGHDAVHCAAGLILADSPDTALASADAKLLSAWTDSGAAVFDASAP
ncbi:type II toxin-antitoxin system VapC family toxin [Pseudarthrobacter sp. N5]|uniref:type II toxin-antitoxin system VapC family toxin n=1 Tax=Pseudarthrobacter sp. N5 TaxID=3418416 RepID=UPI003CEFE0AF